MLMWCLHGCWLGTLSAQARSVAARRRESLPSCLITYEPYGLTHAPSRHSELGCECPLCQPLVVDEPPDYRKRFARLNGQRLAVEHAAVVELRIEPRLGAVGLGGGGRREHGHRPVPRTDERLALPINDPHEEERLHESGESAATVEPLRELPTGPDQEDERVVVLGERQRARRSGDPPALLGTDGATSSAAFKRAWQAPRLCRSFSG